VLSAGILMYRRMGPKLEVLLVHPGGPYWRRKDNGAWSIPKGEMDAGEDAGTLPAANSWRSSAARQSGLFSR
jgi:predicted NUDIX family NTP pyrophosphohydrolase